MDSPERRLQSKPHTGAATTVTLQRRRCRFIDGLIWYKEIIKMHHTHDHQNAAAGANTSLAHHEQGHQAIQQQCHIQVIITCPQIICFRLSLFFLCGNEQSQSEGQQQSRVDLGRLVWQQLFFLYLVRLSKRNCYNHIFFYHNTEQRTIT